MSSRAETTEVAVEELGIKELEDVILECQKGINSNHARQLRAMALLARKSQSEFDSDQIALLLRWPPGWASNRLAFASRVVEVLPASLAALEAGTIDLYKVESLSDLTRGLATEQAREAESLVLRKAPEQTGVAMRRYARRMIARVDPEGARARAAVRKSHRRATLVPEDDDMATVSVYVQADKAVAVKDRVDRLARNAKAPGDSRTLDQRRADVVCDLLLGKQSSVRAHIYVTVPLTTLMCLDDRPGELTGYGPITAHLTRGVSGAATWQRLLTDPKTGALLDVGQQVHQSPGEMRRFVELRDQTCCVPGCVQPAERCTVDHTDPSAEGPMSPDACGLECFRHHRMKLRPDWTLVQGEPGTFTLTTPTGRTYTRGPEPVYPV